MSNSPAPPPVPNGPLARYLHDPGQETARFLHHLAHLLVAVALHVGIPAGGIVLLGLAAFAFGRRAQLRRSGARASSVEVLCPPEVDKAGAEQLWGNLVALLRPAWRRAVFGQPHLCFELVANALRVSIRLWVPAEVPPGLVERAVEAAWPGARTTTTTVVPPLPLGARATGGRLRLAEPEWYPLRAEHPADPLRALLGAFAGLGDDETACVQVLARPATGRRLTRAHRAAAHRRAGRPASATGRLLDLFTPGPAQRPATGDPSREADVRAILDKTASPTWAVAVRYGVATTAAGPDATARLRGRAHAVASSFALYAGRNRFDRTRLRRPADVLAVRWLGRGQLLSVAELAAVAHLPGDVGVAGLARAGAKAVAPPPEIYTEGKVLGDAEAGSRRAVAISVEDARHHEHVIGATGVGKSTLLLRQALCDIEAKRGLVMIDPKGDLVEEVLARIPKGATDRVVLIDPEEREALPVVNVLAGPEPDLAVDNLVGIFKNIFSAYWGPRTDDVLRAACLTLLRYSASAGGATSLAEVPRLLSEEAFRAPRVEAVSDDTVGLGGFWRWYEQMSEASRSQVIGPVMNKLRAFLLRDFVRAVVGRPTSSFDMADVLDGGILLVRVPKGILGEDTARLLGSFVVAKVWQAATHRARLGQPARVDATLMVDECQNFLHLPRSFDDMLAEARGYRLSMVLAHQHLGQLPRELREAVSANARNKVFFSMSPEDARALSRQVGPELTEHDLAHLGAYQAACRLVVDGEEAPAFTIRTRPAPPATSGRADQVRRAARARGRRVDEGDAGIELQAVPEEATATEARVASPVVSGVASPVVSGVALSHDPLHREEPAGHGGESGSSEPADWGEDDGESSLW